MPFLAAALPFITAGGAAAGAIAKGRSAGRQQENAYNQDQDRARLGMAQFNAQMPGLRAHNAVRGDLLAGAQPFKLQGEGRNLSSTGGVSPALFSQGTRDLGQSMNRQAVLSQLGGGQGPADPAMKKAKDMKEFMQMAMDRRTNAMAPPDPYGYLTPTPMKQPGLLDKILGGAGLAGSVAGMLPFGKHGQPMPGYQDPDEVGYD